MPIRNAYHPGEHLIVCDRCGATYLSSHIRKEWTGLLTCHGPGTRQCWEPRHPVDYIRSVPDRPEVEDARTRSDVFQSVTNTRLYWFPNYTDDENGNNPYVSP